SPLQGRAAFIKNWDWQLVTSLNRGSCDRGKALHGHNSETYERVRQRWEEHCPRELTLGDTLDFLLECHRSAPFLFFNDNTFGEIARRIVDAIFIENAPSPSRARVRDGIGANASRAALTRSPRMLAESQARGVF